MKRLVQFRFGEKGIQIVEKLKEDLSFSSRAEVIRLALNFLNWTIHCIEDGFEVTVTKGEGKSERIRIPFLELQNIIENRELETVSRPKKIKEKICV